MLVSLCEVVTVEWLPMGPLEGFGSSLGNSDLVLFFSVKTFSSGTFGLGTFDLDTLVSQNDLRGSKEMSIFHSFETAMADFL